MLCKDCGAFFESRGEEWREKYLELKREAVHDLKSDPRTAQMPQLRDFELDLEIFQVALDLRTDSRLPCPWYKGDLSWIPEEFEQREDVKIDIWTMRNLRRGFDIAVSASSGCELCGMLCAVTQEFNKLGEPAEFDFESWLHLDSISLEPTELLFIVDGSEVDHYVFNMHIDVQRRHEAPQPRLQIPIGNNSSDSSCFNVLLQSFHTCINLHSSCRQDSEQGWIPTRLIDVGPPSNKCDMVRLVQRKDLETESYDRKFDYFTLSHVWGNDKFLTLTSTNMESFKTGLPICNLRKSFQDAIAMTRRLHIQYLWIDSLCILQDSNYDWQLEASTMEKVYSNGLCNLAACNGADEKSGFFRQRNPVAGGPFSILWNWSDGIEKLNIFYDWSNTVKDHTPLNARGWVMQERLLSPRTMFFSTFPFWECREMMTCEAYPLKEFSDMYEGLAVMDKLNVDHFRDPEISNTAWNGVISTYSRCSLTVESDKLIALCGIAKRVGALHGGEYLAGIWSRNLLTGLLWQNSKQLIGTGLGNERSSEFIAPSWSWASVKGPIDPFEGQISHPLANILSASTTSQNQDPYGKLLGGELRISCTMFKVPSLRKIVEDRENYEDTVEHDDWAFSIDDCGEDCFDLETYFLPLAESSDFSDKINLDFGGILAQRDSNCGQKRAFQRIGFVVVSNDGNIAGSGWRCEKWAAPPWPEDIFQQVIIT